jgi:hypothetical protein
MLSRHSRVRVQTKTPRQAEPSSFWRTEIRSSIRARTLVQRLFLAGRRSLPMSIVAGPAYAGELAHAFDSDLALRPRRCHRLDDFVDAVPPGAPLRRRCSLTCRKACRKKSSSTCCRPILRSSAGIVAAGSRVSECCVQRFSDALLASRRRSPQEPVIHYPVGRRVADRKRVVVPDTAMPFEKLRSI